MARYTADTVKDAQIVALRERLPSSHYMYQYTIDALWPSSSHPNRMMNARRQCAEYISGEEVAAMERAAAEYVAAHERALTERLTALCAQLPADREDDGEAYLMLAEEVATSLGLDLNDDDALDAINDSLTGIVAE